METITVNKFGQYYFSQECLFILGIYLYIYQKLRHISDIAKDWCKKMQGPHIIAMLKRLRLIHNNAVMC